jgi:aminopeptidase N
MLGEKVFDQALRSFYSQHRFQRATAEDFRQCFGHGTVMPLQTFFEQWIDRPFLPRLTVQNVESSMPNPVITLRITQAEPVFSLPVELRLTTATGAVITNCLLTQARQQIETRIPGPLLDLEVDPRGKLLLELPADTHALDKPLLQAKAAYEGLLAAHRANQLDALGNQSKELRNIFRRFSAAMNVEQLRRQLSDRGPLDAKTKLQIEESEQLKAAMESFFAKAVQPADLGRLLREIAESADEIHDGVRDNKPEQIASNLPKLTKAWGQFSGHVRACSRIGF